MTVSSTIARCPRCGDVKTVYIRSDDKTDLVCLAELCRGGGIRHTQNDAFPLPPRQSLRSQR